MPLNFKKKDIMKKQEVAFSGKCRAVISDIDGTFLTNGKQLIPKNLEAIAVARRMGVPFIFATGRMYASILPWVEMLGLEAPQILNNGANVILPATQAHIAHFCLLPDAVRLIDEEARNKHFVPIYFSGNGIYAEETPAEAWMIERNNESISVAGRELIDGRLGEIEKIVILAQERCGELAELAKYLNGRGEAENLGINARFSETGILNINSIMATKREGIKAVCKYLGFSPADVMAVGDGDNDADMLASVGLGVAMGNATPLSRQAALTQVGDNEHAGLAQAITAFVIKQDFSTIK